MKSKKQKEKKIQEQKKRNCEFEDDLKIKHLELQTREPSGGELTRPSI